MEDGPGKTEMVQKVASILPPEEWHTRNGKSPRLEARPIQTTPTPSSLQPSIEQLSRSPLLPMPFSTHRPAYTGSPATANNQLVEARPGPSPINHPTVSSRSASSPLTPNAQNNRVAQYRQLPRLKTLVTQNTTPGGRDCSPLINELERSPGKENKGIASPVHASASRECSQQSPTRRAGVHAVPITTARQRAATTSHSLASEPAIPLRPSNSIPDYKCTEPAPVRSGNLNTPLRRYRHYRDQDVQESDYSGHPSDTSPGYDRYDQEQLRTSFRSGVTTGSSFMGNSSCTERDSIVTGTSSMGDAAALVSDEMEEKGGGMSVDEAIGMYERGFHDDDEEEKEGKEVNEPNDMGYDVDGPLETPSDSPSQVYDERQGSAASIDRTHAVTGEIRNAKLSLPQRDQSVKPLEFQSNGPSISIPRPQGPLYPRDRYGFRKETQHITVAQYDAWNATYTQTLERRRRKWIALMKEHGLSTQSPVSFPPRSTKVKRFVRKGIPPDWRGAAWFWYSGGSAHLVKHSGLYDDLVHQAEKGDINKNDREMIERDLNRTFPDNIRFKPDPTASYDAAGNAGGGGGGRNGSHDPQQQKQPHCSTSDEQPSETPILQSLRRVLQAFSIHNPKIGYCQSLNFLAGLLLLFMNEEKTFWMLNIITGIYLPGTHSINLEGANVDLAVLMTSIEESLPTIWAKINDCPPPHRPSHQHSSNNNKRRPPRLPTISLCTTSWFMSCFIGTLPIESVLRVWDSFFYEGSKTLFRIALTIFKLGEPQIKAVNDPMEIFLVVQTIPRKLVDAGALMEACFKRRGGFAQLSQLKVDERRRRWRRLLAGERAGTGGGAGDGGTGGGDGKGRKEKLDAGPVADVGVDDVGVAAGKGHNGAGNGDGSANANNGKGRWRLNRMMTMNGRIH